MAIGRTRFTEREADQIRALLREKARADKNEQKNIRRRLRDQLHFHIRDFSQTTEAFTLSDFNDLITAGAIVISN